ncbi:MAG: PD-(D/E)XK nuclease domain-containing protein, partial [Bernardetiaceae bacterium]|nr:PD-(D/E)XK nuclease domain-containing protein [Bernardetiaceae bacterium]
FESGTPKFLISQLKERMVYDLSAVEVTFAEADSFDLDQLSLETLLLQTGYLTIKQIDEFNIYHLGYPNMEVEESMMQYLLAAFSHSKSKVALAYEIVTAVERNDVELLVSTINGLFGSIPYQLFSPEAERYFHAIIFLAFRLCGFHIDAEVSVAGGRVDAVMRYQERVYVFEFKLNDSAESALKQIHQRGYYHAFKQEGKEVYLVGMSFSGQTKSITQWKMEKV